MEAVGFTGETIHAPGGEEALQLLSTNKLPSLIALHLTLPKMPGLEVKDRIRKRYPIPVILYTSACPGAKKEVADKGAMGCFEKNGSYPDLIHLTNWVVEFISIDRE